MKNSIPTAFIPGLNSIKISGSLASNGKPRPRPYRPGIGAPVVFESWQFVLILAN